MTELSEDVIKSLADCREAIIHLETEYEKKRNDLTIPFRIELEKLLVARQPEADQMNWGRILGGADAPTAEFLNETTDTKLLRAIESFKVTTSIRDGGIFRKVEIKLRPNVLVESLYLFREVDANDKTTDISGITWKAGTEKSRSDSMFRFFDESSKAEEFLVNAITAFEMVFQSPLLFQS